MKKYFFGMVSMMLLGTVHPSYALFGRDSVSSLWSDNPVQIDGRATEWAEMPVVEESGVSVRAMNDASSLYLLIRGTTNEGRVLLSGKYRENVALWFLKPDHQSRAWGINLDFSRMQEPAPDATPTLESIGIIPERVLPQGLEVSTATFPEGFEFQADLSSQRGRQPIYEIRIPLSMIEHSARSIFLDLVSSDISPEMKKELLAQTTELQAGTTEPHENESHHHHGMGGPPGDGKVVPSTEIPKPLNLHLTITLAKEHKHT